MKTTSIIFIIIIVSGFTLECVLAMSDSVTPENDIVLCPRFLLRLQSGASVMTNLVLGDKVGCLLEVDVLGVLGDPWPG